MLKIAVVMDPIETINPLKDSSFAMLLAAQKRAYEKHYISPENLFMAGNKPRAISQIVTVKDQTLEWFELTQPSTINLQEMDVILMRKDPPFDMQYIMDTYILEHAISEKTHVINNPQALRDANEKFFTERFAECTPENIISRNIEILKQYIKEMKDVIIKPMDGMGGNSIFKTHAKDKNLSVILETVTQNGTQTTMVQRFIPDISEGDKRILLINGKAVPYALARIPSGNDFRGNLAKGGIGKGVPLSENDWRIADIVGPKLKQMGIVFAGIDVIGNYLTEVNVTSPTCIRELDEIYDLDIAGELLDCIEQEIL